MKHTSRTSVKNQPSGHRLPGFEGVPVALRGDYCIAFFKLISFVGGSGSPKDKSSIGDYPEGPGSVRARQEDLGNGQDDGEGEEKAKRNEDWPECGRSMQPACYPCQH